MKILIVDDQRLVSEGLAALGERLPERPTTRRANDGLEAVAAAREFEPDVIVMDLAMPGMNGLEATRQIVQDAESPAAVIVLSVHAESEFVAEAMRCGAKGYLVKSAASDELAAAIRRVLDGQRYLSPTIATDALESFLEGKAGRSGDAQTVPAMGYALLSPRERQTLQLLADGMSVKEIAFKLELSDKTVHAFRANLMEKLEIGSIAQLTKYAIKHGLTPLN
ncbi:MAG: response regulator transcription factor [Planctomycetota bacterium]